jgi:membrane protein
MNMKKDKKRLAIIGLMAGFLAAGLKTRQPYIGSDVPHVSGGPAKLSLSEWKHALIETKNALGSKNLSVLAAGIAYYSTLAIFPLLAAGVAIAALLITPEQLQSLVDTAEAYLPGDISGVIAAQLETLVARRTDNLLAAGVAIVIALFSASGASKNLVIASNVAYGVKESRGWLMQQILGIMWTISGILFGFIVALLLAVNQAALEHFGVPPSIGMFILYGRWLVILLCTILGLAIFYRYGPNRPSTRWEWVSWGAVIATIVWLAATALFFAYVQNFGNYAQSYSLFAGIIVLMVWLNLSALIVLLGAEVNHRLETAGREKQARSS